jgi:hypothetical protein
MQHMRHSLRARVKNFFPEFEEGAGGAATPEADDHLLACGGTR